MSICPYCRTEVPEEGEGRIFCCGCGTPHHKECYDENGGCTLFGCKFAPPDESKIQVTGHDVRAVIGSALLPNLAGQQGIPATGFGDTSARQIFIPAPSTPPLRSSGIPPPPPPSSAGVPRTLAVAAHAAPAVVPHVGYRTTGSILGIESVEQGSIASASARKSRVTFIILGILLGAFGIHNFYARYTKRAVAQLCITLLTFFYGSLITAVWAIVEVCTVDRDGNNNDFY